MYISLRSRNKLLLPTPELCESLKQHKVNYYSDFFNCPQLFYFWTFYKWNYILSTCFYINSFQSSIRFNQRLHRILLCKYTSDLFILYLNGYLECLQYLAIINDAIILYCETQIETSPCPEELRLWSPISVFQ